MIKNILFLCCPNGIGKTTICKEIIKQLPNSASIAAALAVFLQAERIMSWL